jgi:3-oxoacyl-[acyl-carrier-protein] synthase III
MTLRSRVIGWGSALPALSVSNDDLAQKVDTSNDWIVQRTGIKSRYIAGAGETTSSLATAAAEKALACAGVSAEQVDLIIVATTTPDRSFPATAVTVQAALGVTQGFAFDMQAVCSGFVYALATADNFIRSGQVKTALVIGAETFSRLLDWTDRTTCVLFGDGAGAVVLQASTGDGTAADRGILSTHLHSDGRLQNLLYTDGGPSLTQTAGHVKMEGKEVFRHAVAKLADIVGEALTANGLTSADIDWLVPHQANRRILESTAQKLNLPLERVVMTLDQHGNTSAASIPLALDVAARDGRLQPGQLVLLEALGGGLTWGAAVLRW